MIFKTERLTLRPWREEDAEHLYHYAKDPDVGPVAGWPPHKSTEDSRRIIQDVLSAPETYAICLEGEPIGSIGLKMGTQTDLTERADECELGYWLGKPHWGKGYMPEAAEELLHHAFEDLKMRAVWCGYYDGNAKSRRVQEKLGFVYQFTTQGVEVPLLKETRTGHVSLLTAEQWRKERNLKMRKDFGAKTWVYPMPVFIVAAYDKVGKANCMNAAWAGIYDTDQVMVCLADDHKTTKNILESKAFTVSIADAAHVVEADYVGIVSGNKETDKMEKAGLTTVPSAHVNAPIINEFPMTVECELIKFNEDGICIGKIVNVSAVPAVLGEDGLIDPAKLGAITYDPVHHTYLKLGEKVGNAFSDGKELKK